jgi:hypothetical protein
MSAGGKPVGHQKGVVHADANGAICSKQRAGRKGPQSRACGRASSGVTVACVGWLAACRLGGSHFEPIQKLRKLDALFGQAGTSSVHFLDHCRVLLRDLVHVVDGGVNLRQAQSLFLGGGGNRLHVLMDRVDQICDLLQASASITDQSDALGDCGLGVADQTLDLLSRLGRTLGKLADLLRHHRKALAGFAGTGRFYTRIEGSITLMMLVIWLEAVSILFIASMAFATTVLDDPARVLA